MGSKDKEKDQELLKKLLLTFKLEAEEHVHAISSGLIELEKTSSLENQGEIIEQKKMRLSPMHESTIRPDQTQYEGRLLLPGNVAWNA